jgi:hypothetical protein
MTRRAALFYLCAATSCGDRLTPLLCDGGACGTQVSWRKNYQSTVDRAIDILFVVDDTSAIAPYSATVARGLADMATTLEALPQPASLHVGFVRAGGCDASTRGAACSLTAPEQFIREEWCEMNTNFPGAFADTFSCLGDLGAANCAPAQPLAAAQQALSAPPRPGWEGFLRPNAYLLVVIIAGGDDASGAAVSDVAAFVRGLKSDPSYAGASAIVPASCAPAPSQRLIEFVETFGANGVLIDLCGDQLASALLQVTRRIETYTDPVCVTNVRDTDPETPGLQAACTFTDHVAPDGSFVDSTLPSCDETAGAPPCWRLVAGCGSGYILDIDRGVDWCDEAGQYVTIECLGCADANDPACAPQTQAR